MKSAIKIILKFYVYLSALTFNVCLGGLLLFYISTRPSPQLPVAQDFLAKLNGAHKAGKRYIYLKDMTSFPWEKICFIPSYMPEEEIQALVGKEYQIDNLNTGEDTYVLFLLADRKTLPVRVPHAFYDPNVAKGCMTYQKANSTPLPFEKEMH